MLLVNSPKGNHRVVISKYGELSDAEYLDPRGNCVIRFDHIRQEVIGSRQLSGELDSSVENYRAALEEEAFKYAAEHYVNGAATVYGTQGKVIICIASEKFQPNNFWYEFIAPYFSVMPWTGMVDGGVSGHAAFREEVFSLMATSKSMYTTMKMVMCSW